MTLEANNGSNGKNWTDPWSDTTWSKPGLAAFHNDTPAPVLDGKEEAFAFKASEKDVESQLMESTSFDTKNHFRDGKTRSTIPEVANNTSSEHVPATDNSPTIHNANEGLVRVAIHEQVSALYDGVTDEPACHVEGSLYVRPSEDLQAKPFLLVVRDSDNHVAHWKDWPSTCRNVSDKVSRKGLHRTDRVLQISTRCEEQKRTTQSPRSLAEETLIGQYICSDRVRPVPLLIKSRVVTNHRYCRVGFKIRANPSNNVALTSVVLLLAVPPHIEGRTAKMSRKGGVWDELRRTISWVVPNLEPGAALEIQVQFEGPGNDGSQENNQATPRFPILARGDYGESYSSLEVRKSDAGRGDAILRPVHTLKVNRSGRVLHRKV
eukprot:CAMPEP_0168717970 /NCGR_PEP_ID=MMETSP0724-20121128/273_1 /TAXON_ID=265536 /ORGANISM="Amphiprora sp., Strain CCMP467" /LENGTH=377 /DNA_ID=CAMNT_0008764461 /DNA_START=8 /DNA_END=1141 /DNA_ORIENTATION=-